MIRDYSINVSEYYQVYENDFRLNISQAEKGFISSPINPKVAYYLEEA